MKAEIGVVVAVSSFVVLRRAPLEGVGDGVDGDGAPALRIGFGGERCHLQGVESDAGITVGDVDEMGQSIGIEGWRNGGESTAVVGQGAVDDVGNLGQLPARTA